MKGKLVYRAQVSSIYLCHLAGIDFPAGYLVVMALTKSCDGEIMSFPERRFDV
jgi:hypothetical protein